MGAIGYFMKESGMEDILVESKVCGRGTANKVMLERIITKCLDVTHWYLKP